MNRIRLANARSRPRKRLADDDRLTSATRCGDRQAFEAIYDRYGAELLRFSVYMLGSQSDAEDAVQETFAAAYRALLADQRPIVLRPWLFTITRNQCVSILRSRRQTVELNGEISLTGDPVQHLELSEQLREMLAAIRDLPERQRAALVLAEAHGLAHPEIAEVLGVRPEQVKALVYQARTNILADRRARDADCEDIRRELMAARGPVLLRGRLRRHLRLCDGCREYAAALARERGQLRALLPFAPSLALKHRVLEGALGLSDAGPGSYAGGMAVGASMVGVAEIAGGVNALVLKVAAGAIALIASAGVGAGVLKGGHHSTRGGVPVSSIAGRPPTRPARFADPPLRREATFLASPGRREGTNRGQAAIQQDQPQRGLTQGGAPVGSAHGQMTHSDVEAASPVPHGKAPNEPQADKPKRSGAKKLQAASKREAAHQHGVGENEQHAKPAAREVPPSEGHPVPAKAVEHQPEGVAKGPPTTGELQQKQESHESKKEEHGPGTEPEKGPKGPK